MNKKLLNGIFCGITKKIKTLKTETLDFAVLLKNYIVSYLNFSTPYLFAPKKYLIYLAILFSSNLFAEETYLLWKNNGLALNGISSSNKSVDLAYQNSIVKTNQRSVISFEKNNKKLTIDLTSSLNYKVITQTNTFIYKSTSDNKIIDFLSHRTVVFDIQNIGDYLLFLEDTKITCFNLKTEKPCSKFIQKIESKNNQTQNGEITILFKELFFYENKNNNEIIQCPTGVGFDPKTHYITFCGDKKRINLNNFN